MTVIKKLLTYLLTDLPIWVG